MDLGFQICNKFYWCYLFWVCLVFSSVWCGFWSLVLNLAQVISNHVKDKKSNKKKSRSFSLFKKEFISIEWSRPYLKIVYFIENLWPRNAEDKIVWRSFINLFKTKISQCLSFRWFFSFIFFYFVMKSGRKADLNNFYRRKTGIIDVTSAIADCRGKLERQSSQL